MSHLTLYHVVRVKVETTDTTLLDSLETTVADVPDDVRGPEIDGPTRTDVRNSDETRLTARVTFVSDANGEQAATDLYNALTGHSLPNDATVKHYKSPIGIVSVEDVRQWHENNAPDCDCGSAWDPTEHTVSEWGGR